MNKIFNKLIHIFAPIIIFWIIYRPDVGTNIVQWDLTPYFIDPLRTLKETISIYLPSWIFVIEKSPNFWSSFISIIFLILSPFNIYSQQIFYFISIYFTFYLITKSINNKYSVFISIFLTFVLFKNIFWQYQLSPPLFHICFVPLLILVLNFKEKFKNQYFYYFIVFILSVIVSSNLTFLFIIISFHFIKDFVWFWNLLKKENIILTLVFLFSWFLLLFYQKHSSESEIQMRINNEIEAYKYDWYDSITSLWLVDRTITSSTLNWVNNYYWFFSFLWEYYGSLLISTLIIFISLFYKSYYILWIYLFWVLINYSLRFFSIDIVNLYFDSIFFSLLRDYKKVWFVFVSFLVVFLIRFVNDKKYIPAFLIFFILFIYMDANILRPIYHNSMKVVIPYDYKKYDKLIDDDKSLLFLPISTNNYSMSQLDSTNWWFNWYNILHYFHTNYLDTARLQNMNLDKFNDLKKYNKCDLSWLDINKFDYILYRKDLVNSNEFYCQLNNLKFNKVYEDNYVIIYKK